MSQKQQIRVFRSRRETTKKPYFKPRMIMKEDGKSVITESKWYPDQRSCVFDWYQRGFLVIEDETIGGGFDVGYFPVVDLSKIKDAFTLKFKKDKKND